LMDGLFIAVPPASQGADSVAPTIYRDNLPCHERTCIAEAEHHTGCDFVRLPDAPHGCLGNDVVDGPRICRDGQFCCCEARSDGVDTHTYAETQNAAKFKIVDS
jgi:hypothetical protein